MMAKGTIRYAFLVMSLISFFCINLRADYNLPFGIFAFLSWDTIVPFSQKTRILYLLVISLIADAAWLLSYLPLWIELNQRIFELVQIASLVNIGFKLIIVIYMVCVEQDCKKALGWTGFKKNLNSFFWAESSKHWLSEQSQRTR